ncbi:MAG: hypothetical protein QM820_12635 [Minicystis sp.]
MSHAHLDWKDEAAVQRWLADLRIALDDIDAVAADMLRPPDERELGPVKHRELYGDGRRSVVEMIEFARPSAAEPVG